MASTLFDKIWDRHAVETTADGEALILIDRLLLHERMGSVALKSLEADGRSVATPEHVFCLVDHIVDTFSGRSDETRVPGGQAFIRALRESAKRLGLTLFDIDDDQQGIVHVVAPEQGIALPGLSIVCPDSHTCTQGALGALAWGIGSTDAEHALATGTLRLKRPPTMRVTFDGHLSEGVTAKDLALALIQQHGAAGGQDHAIEFAGEAVRALDVESRMTLCNMAVEFGAFTALIAPDVAVFEYVSGRPYAPKGDGLVAAQEDWRQLFSDEGATFDREVQMDASAVTPMVTWGTSPEHAVAIDGQVPDPMNAQGSDQRDAMLKALSYTGIEPGTPMPDLKIDGAFIGSCTNSRLGDLRRAAEILKGRSVAKGVRAICVPGSTRVKREAEAEGLDRIFIDAGFEWRESGCSMCFYAGGESFGYQQRVITSTNRNFESRQGPEVRSHLASPETVAASAIEGQIADARKFSGKAK